MRCLQCGQFIENDSKFCKYCGSKQNPEYEVKYIFSTKDRTIVKETGLPQDSHFNTFTYFWNEDSAMDAFMKKYDQDCRIANRNSDNRVGEICYPGYDENGSCLNFVNEHPNNSLDNIIQYYDKYHQYNNTLRHETRELSLAKLTPSIVVNPYVKNNICVFIFKEYVVLNDDNHVGYMQKEEFFSEASYAMERQQEEFLKYKNDPSYSFEIFDKRDSYMTEVSEYDTVWYYGIHVYKNGHRVRHLDVCARILRN